MLDLLITEGVAATGQGLQELDVGIVGEKIAGLFERGKAPAAKEVVSGRGCYVLPGFIDPHFHCRAPSRPDRETWLSASRAAAAGGVTTLLEMPQSVPPACTPEVVRSRREAGERESYVDFALYGGGGGDHDAVLALAAEGVIGFKVLMHRPPAGREAEFEGLCVTDHARLYGALKAVADTDLPCVVHAEDDSLLDARIRELQAAGRNDPIAHAESRPAYVEAAAIATLLVLAEEVSVRLHVAHLSTAWGVRLVRDGKSRGLRLSAETCPHYLLFNDRETERLGCLCKVNPPLRGVGDPPALWDGIRNGTIDAISSDHAPYRPEEKRQENVWLTPAGFPGVEVVGHAILTEALAGRIPLRRAVEVLSEGPARVFGLWPRKGSIAVGADADMVLYDSSMIWSFQKAAAFSLARENYDLYEGRQFGGRVIRTIVRGRTVYASGDFPCRPGHGRFVRPHRVQ